MTPWSERSAAIRPAPPHRAPLRTRLWCKLACRLGCGARHAGAEVSSGDLGWIQMANFIVVGALYVLCAAAIGRSWHLGARPRGGHA